MAWRRRFPPPNVRAYFPESGCDVMCMGMLVLVAGGLLINEILYDPPGADGGQVFVDLINADSTAIAWSSLVLEVGDGAQPGTWRRVWEQQEGSLGPGGLQVIGGSAVPEATQRLSGTLQNGPDALRLLVGGRVVDLVGYGVLRDAGMYETSPAEDVASQSLSRLPDGHDTNNNSFDLHGRTPSPGRRNQPQLEWQLQILEPQWHRFWPGRHIHVQAVLRNIGTQTTTATQWQLQAELQWTEPAQGPPLSERQTRRLQVQHVPVALALGDSAILEVVWVGDSGLFTLILQSLGRDEWAGDNRDTLFGRVGAGPVVINEVLYAPLGSMPEWVELWNRSTQPVDVNGWTLGDASGRVGVLRADRPLAADGFAVAREDPLQAVAGEADAALRVEVRPWPSLNNTDNELGIADILTLRDASGLVQDAVFYSGARTVHGRSLERVYADADVRGVLWGLSKDPQGATPGRGNSIAGGIETVGSVSVQPRCISPNGDGQADVLHIRLQVPEGQEGFRARLFDLQGRLRRDLAGDQLGPGERHLLWDATDDSGAIVELGVYLIHFEFYGKSVGAPRLVRTVGVVHP